MGPATESPGVLKELIEAGADVFRINLSHGTHEEHIATARRARDVARSMGREIALLADLCGPKVRTGVFEDGLVELATGDVFTLDTSGEEFLGNAQRVSVSYQGVADDLSRGNLLLFDDGLLEISRGHLFATRTGWPVLNAVTAKLLA